MISYTKVIAFAALALGMPAAAAAQQVPQQGRAPVLNRVHMLIEAKDELNATADQVAKLEEISRKFEAETAKLREEMQKARRELMGGDQRALMQKMRPIREEFQKKDEAAVAEALKLLSDDQKKIAEQLIAAQSEERPRRRAARPDMIRE